MKNLLSVLCLLLLFGCNTIPKQERTLWYNTPAETWNEALPIGNGRIGAMVFGRPETERIQLNDDSMWPGSPEWGNPPGLPEDLKKIRELLMAGNHVSADKMVIDKFSRKSVVRSHQTLGDLWLDFDHEDVTDYHRELDLNNAVIRISYNVNGDRVTQSIFASAPDQAIIMEVSTNSEYGLNGTIRLTRPLDEGFPTVKTRAENNMLIMNGEVTQRGGMVDSKPMPILHGVKFETRVHVKNKGGSITPSDDHLFLDGVKTATFYIVNNTDFYFEDYSQKNSDQLRNIVNKGFDALLRFHQKDYQLLFNRVTIDLNNNGNPDIPTDQRLDNIKKGQPDRGMEELLFQYGRYLLISSSRRGTNPANLQGLWNPHIKAPWNADYHLNINLQMNYWPAMTTNLMELQLPLFDFGDRLVKRGKSTAKENFGIDGAMIPHATDLWAPAWLRAPTAYWGASFGAGGWLAQHYWRHYEFTGDKAFLKDRVYPVLHEIAQFYADWLMVDPRDGTLISAPATSPENRFFDKDGNKVATCLGSAMDQQVIAEVFDHYVEMCSLLNLNPPLMNEIVEKRKILRSGMVIGSNGRILEWDREYDEPEKGHRHMSHLYAFHPGDAVSKKDTPALFDAVKKTLAYRLEHGGAGTGWSRAWLINCYGRLMEGDLAYAHIQQLFQRSIQLNLFDSHPPFQIDGNFGYTAGVVEMLLQSFEDNTIRILPALPEAWSSGNVTGLTAKGNFIVDIHWENNRLKKAVVTAPIGGKTNLIYGEKIIPVALMPNESFTHRND